MKRWITLLMVMVLTIAIAACGGGGTENNDANDASEQQGNETNQEQNDHQGADGYPLTVTDSTGEEIVFETAPERIVSTSPAETEILFAIGAGDKVVGRSQFDNFPSEVTEIQSVGSVYMPDEEVILQLEPDVVFGGISLSEDAASRFRELDIKIYSANPNSVEDILNNILVIGQITNHQEQAEELVQEMRDTIDQITSAVEHLTEDERKRVYVEFAPGWTVGEGEYMSELLALAGGMNIAKDVSGWNAINEEMIIQEDPEIILYAAGLIEDGVPIEELIVNRSGWDQITAIQNDDLYGLNDDILARPGPRIVEALESMAESIYPELFQ